jgi:plastocyanin
MNKLRFAIVTAALAAMSACGSSYSAPASPTPTPTPTPGSGGSVSIPSGARTLGSAAYAPNPLTVNAGTMVTWTNGDSIAHTVTSDNGVFDSGSIAASGKYSFTFNTKGTFSYHCTFHSGMVGQVVVQ